MFQLFTQKYGVEEPNYNRLYHTKFHLDRCRDRVWEPVKYKFLEIWEYTLHLKKRPTFTTCYDFCIHSSIATIFGTNVAEKVGNYFPTSPN